uniref:Exportin-T n=1 Tax=Haemonchus contortus TaxID=6289 RepID=A0A7I4YH90_HAECO
MTAVNSSLNGNPFGAPGSINDPARQAQLYHYLETLKTDENGWRKSTDNIIANNLSTDEEHFLLLQVIEDYLARRYAGADADSVMCIRGLLSHWIQKLSAHPDQPSFLINKMAHIFSLVFAADFPDRWPTFMDDIFLSRGLDSVPLVVFYLKTLLAIDSEVVDRDIQRTKTVFDRNTKIKDFMRDLCIPQIVQSWWTILEQCSDVTAQCLCLDAVAAFVDWIDVELVANDVFVPLVIARLGNKDISEAAVRAVSALIQKGMPASKKLSLVTALMDVMRNNHLINVNPNSDYEDVLRAGSLLSAVGNVLIDTYHKFKAEDGEEDARRCIEIVEADMDSLLLVLDNEDPDLSELVVYTLRSYVALFKDKCMEEKATSVFTKIVSVCLRRFVISEELDVDGSGEDEIEFAEYRKELRGILNTIGNMRADLIVAPLEVLVDEVAASGGGTAMPIARLEAIVQLVHGLVEIIPANFVNMKEGWMGRGALLPVNLLNSMQLDGRSATVHVLYFEIACRYERLLMARPQPVIPQVASAFLDERGIAFRVARVRTRIVYLFCRFVKAHKTVLSPLVSEVISRLAPLLAMSPHSDQLLTADDQAFIFEATGTLIVFGELGVDQKSVYIGELANKLGERFLAAVTELQAARAAGDAAKVQMIQQFMTNIVGYCCRLSKAFNNANSMQSCRCVDVYMRLLNLFLGHLSAENAFLLEPVRQLAHRLVVCLDSELLPILPPLMSALAAVSTDLDSMNHLLILSHQIVAKFKKECLHSGVDFGAILASAARLSMESEPTPALRAQDETAYRNLIYVRRAFLQLFYTSTTSDMLNEIATGTLFDNLLEAATHLALSSDQSCQKLALATLSRTSATNAQWWQRTLRTALEVPSLPHISSSDAGSTVVVHEVASTLQTLRQAHPEEFAVAVRSLMPGELAVELLSMLENLKSRALDKQLLLMYDKIRLAQQQQQQQT